MGKVLQRKRSAVVEQPEVKGFFRLKVINPDGSEAGDSGWQENTVVNLGFSQDLVDPLIGGTAKAVARMIIGTGTAPAVDTTGLPGEITHVASINRVTVGTANASSKTARFTATWASSASHLSAGVTIANIGLINNTTSGGTILCGNTYSSSAWGTKQDVQATYEIRFA